MIHSRRDFLKTSVAGAAGAMIVSGTATRAQAAYSDKMAINPDISNLRVVCCHDPAMIKQTASSWSYTNQNNSVDSARIKADIDEMAKSLAQKSSAAEAWATIFRKPSAKQWPDVKVAIKFSGVCCGTQNMPRAAVVGKVCDALVGLGAIGSNIKVYDTENSGSLMNQFLSPYIGNLVPAGVIAEAWLGGSLPIDVPGFGTKDCRKELANGTIDILVNIASHRGHGGCYGSATLTMKSHFGTFPADHSSQCRQYMAAINKTDPILGGNPVRQQLCIVDSIYEGSPPAYSPAKLVMGTFSPLVDFLTVKLIRAGELGISIDSNQLNQFPTDFGYTLTEWNALSFISVLPASPTAVAQSERMRKALSVRIAILGRGIQPASIDLPLQATGMPITVSIHDMRGRLVRDFAIPIAAQQKGMAVVWDGTAASGMPVPAGTYGVRVSANNLFASGALVVSR